MLAAPILSAYDPVSEAEGGVDGLSLQGIYERLAERVLPFVTVRMARLRFVTAISVGAWVCRKYDVDTVAADGQTPPWLVFEWFVAEALIRNWDAMERPSRIPGRLKIESALRNGFGLSAATYLKTPKVFGATGIYRRLATGLQVVSSDLTLDDGGHELIRAWERDQGLPGFLDGTTGAGAVLRKDLERAVHKGLEAGTTVHRPRGFWQTLCRHFRPDAIGPREREVLYDRLTRTDLIGGVLDSEAVLNRQRLIQAIELRGTQVSRDDEPAFLQATERKAAPGLASCLAAIRRYETLCRIATDAFDLIRHLSTEAHCGPVTAADFAEHPQAGALADAAGAAAAAVLADAELCVWELGAADLARRYAEVRRPEQLFEVALQHHEDAQRAKPPDGKRPWLDRGRPGHVFVRSAYALPNLPEPGRRYVHSYRIPTISSFLVDLGRLPL